MATGARGTGAGLSTSAAPGFLGVGGDAIYSDAAITRGEEASAAKGCGGN